MLDQVHTFQKKITTTGSANIFFFAYLKKKYNDWIKSFSKSKWTGLLLNDIISYYVLILFSTNNACIIGL